MPGTHWVPGGGLDLPVPATPLSDGCHSTHFLPGHHSPFSTWDLSKPTLTVLLPILSLQVLPTPLSTHPPLLETFSNPSPGARPLSAVRHGRRSVTLYIYLSAVCPTSASPGWQVPCWFYSSRYTRSQQGLRNPQCSSAPLNNQRLFQSSRVRCLLPRTS